jgi:hypothetical protein
MVFMDGGLNMAAQGYTLVSCLADEWPILLTSFVVLHCKKLPVVHSNNFLSTKSAGSDPANVLLTP